MQSTVNYIFVLLMSSMAGPFAWATTPQSVQTQINKQQLYFYQSIGEGLMKSLNKDLHSSRDILQGMESHYHSLLKIDRLTANPKLLSRNSVSVLIRDVNHAVQIKSFNQKDFRSNPKVRRKIQNVFLGLMFSIETLSRIHLGQTLDELITLERFLLSKATFFTTEANSKINTGDILFDFLWLRSLKFPVELTELSLKKVRALLNLKPSANEQVVLQKYMGSLAFIALQRTDLAQFSPLNSSGAFERLILAVKETHPKDTEILREAKWLHYNYLQKVGRGSEAYDLKNSLYLDQLGAKAKLLVKEPVKIMSKPELNFFGKLTSSLTSVVRNLFLVGKYSIGFLFVATPLEFIVLLLAFAILSHQGVAFFGEKQTSYGELWAHHRILQSGGWRRLPALVKATFHFILWYIKLAWRMFVTTYTGAAVPFYSKVASSLLLFGVGLYFNSARTLAETLLSLS